MQAQAWKVSCYTSRKKRTIISLSTYLMRVLKCQRRRHSLTMRYIPSADHQRRPYPQTTCNVLTYSSMLPNCGSPFFRICTIQAQSQVEGLRLAPRGGPSSTGSCPLTIGLAERDLLRLALLPLLTLRLRLRDRDTDRLPPGLLLRLRLAALLDLCSCMLCVNLTRYGVTIVDPIDQTIAPGMLLLLCRLMGT